MLRGEVTSGEGAASAFLEKKPYNEFMQETLGFRPFPGTLNLEVDPEDYRSFRTSLEGRKLDSEDIEEGLGGITVFPAEIEGVEAGVIEPERSRYDDSVVEVVAEENLRQKLDLEDGDRVELDKR